MKQLIKHKHYTTDQITQLTGLEHWPFKHYTHPEWLQYNSRLQAQHQIYILPNNQHIRAANTWHSLWLLYKL